MKSTDQSSEIEDLKRRLRAFEEASPDMTQKIKLREEELRAQEEAEKMQREHERIRSNIPNVIDKLSERMPSDFIKCIVPTPHVYCPGDPIKVGSLKGLGVNFNHTHNSDIKEVLQLAFDQMQRQSDEIRELKSTIERFLPQAADELRPNEYVFRDKIMLLRGFALAWLSLPKLQKYMFHALARRVYHQGNV